MSSLNRFIDAHDGKTLGCSSFQIALSEIQNGKKTSHWIWYILPQLKNITPSPSHNSTYYAITDLNEAKQYLQNQTLLQHYLAIIREIKRQVMDKHIPLITVMGSDIDVAKLSSSLTLFSQAADDMLRQDDAEHLVFRDLKTICDDLLQSVMFPCVTTQTLLRQTVQTTSPSSSHTIDSHPVDMPSSPSSPTPPANDPDSRLDRLDDEPLPPLPLSPPSFLTRMNLFSKQHPVLFLLMTLGIGVFWYVGQWCFGHGIHRKNTEEVGSASTNRPIGNSSRDMLAVMGRLPGKKTPDCRKAEGDRQQQPSSLSEIASSPESNDYFSVRPS